MSGKKKNFKGKKCIDKKSVFLVSYLDQTSESDGLFPAYLVKVPTKQQAINYVANTDHNSRNFMIAEKMPIVEPDESECMTEEEDDSDMENLCPDCRRELGMDTNSESDDLEDLEELSDSDEESISVDSDEETEEDTVETEEESENESEEDSDEGSNSDSDD